MAVAAGCFESNVCSTLFKRLTVQLPLSFPPRHPPPPSSSNNNKCVYSVFSAALTCSWHQQGGDLGRN